MIWWGLFGVVLVFLAVSLPMTMGFLLPTEFTGWAFLRKELKRYGIPPDYLPRACVRDLSGQGLRVAEMLSEISGESERTLVVEQMEGIAASVSSYLHYPDAEINRSEFVSDDPVYQILVKHGVPVVPAKIMSN